MGNLEQIIRDRMIAMGGELIALRAELATVKAELDAAQGAIESDRTKLAGILTALDRCLGSRFWLTEGRGSYEWDDDRYREEFKFAVGEILEALKPLRSMAADWSNSPRTAVEIAAARVDLLQKVQQLTADRDALAASNAELRTALENCRPNWHACGEQYVCMGCLIAVDDIPVAVKHYEFCTSIRINAALSTPPAAALGRLKAGALREAADTLLKCSQSQEGTLYGAYMSDTNKWLVAEADRLEADNA